MRYRVTIETRRRGEAGDFQQTNIEVDAGNVPDAKMAAAGQAFMRGLELRFILAVLLLPDEGPDLGQMFDMAYEDQCRDACGPGL